MIREVSKEYDDIDEVCADKAHDNQDTFNLLVG